MNTDLIPEEFEKEALAVFTYLVKTLYPEVRGKLERKYDELTAKKKADILKRAQLAIKNENIMQFLRYKYADEPMLERCGHLYPVAVYPANTNQLTHYETILAKPINRNIGAGKKQFIVDDKGVYRKAVDDLFIEPKDKNNITYSMQKLSIENDGSMQMQCELGTYFDSYDTSEALEWEIRTKANRLSGDSIEDFIEFEAKLPWRQKLHHEVMNPVLDATGRQPAIGMATLIAYKEGDGPTDTYQLMVRQRAKKGVPVRAGQLHVIPSFMFQPTTKIGIDREYDIEHNFFRELLEELYEYPLAIEEGNPEKIYHEYPVKLLKEMMANKTATLYFTGMAVNLLNLRPEICTLLVINDSNWYKRSLTDTNLEWKSCPEFATMKDHDWLDKNQFVGKISFSDQSDEQMFKEGFLLPYLTVPAGAAAFWLGIDALRQISKK